MQNSMFSDQVKQVMQLAREEAARLGHNYIGTEHLLLGIIRGGQKYSRSGTDKSELKSRKYQAIHRRFCRFFWQFNDNG